MKNFKELIIWRKGIEIVKQVYKVTSYIPMQEKFGIISQMTRAAVSVSANIAEGSSLDSQRDYARFIQIALGSAFELQTYLVIVKELEWVLAEEVASLESLVEEEIKMLHSFGKKLRT